MSVPFQYKSQATLSFAGTFWQWVSTALEQQKTVLYPIFYKMKARCCKSNYMSPRSSIKEGVKINFATPEKQHNETLLKSHHIGFFCVRFHCEGIHNNSRLCQAFFFFNSRVLPLLNPLSFCSLQRYCLNHKCSVCCFRLFGMGCALCSACCISLEIQRTSLQE